MKLIVGGAVSEIGAGTVVKGTAVVNPVILAQFVFKLLANVLM